MEGTGGAVSLERGCGTADPAPDPGGRGRRGSRTEPRCRPRAEGPRRLRPGPPPAGHRSPGEAHRLPGAEAVEFGGGCRRRGAAATRPERRWAPSARECGRPVEGPQQRDPAATAAKRPPRSAKPGRPDTPNPRPAPTAAATPALDPRAPTGTRAIAGTPLLASRPPLRPGTPPLARGRSPLVPRPTTANPARGPGPLSQV